MYIIVGLGNPGTKYESTRHNMGFITIDYLSREYNIPVNRLGFKSLYGQGIICGEKVILVKPQTFMNLSGQTVKEIVDFYKVPHNNLIVIYDEISIPLGKLRIRPSGSAGGHNGMKNIIYLLENDKFPRIRVGVGMPDNPKMDIADHVLGKLSSEEIKILTETVKNAAKAVEIIITDSVSTAMNKLN